MNNDNLNELNSTSADNDELIIEDVEVDENTVESVVQTEEEEVLVADKNANVFSGEEEEIDPTKADNKKGESSVKKNFFLTVYDFVSIIMSSFIIIAVVFTFAFRLVGVDGESMTNTLQHGDWLITVNKAEYKYGDIVVVTQDTFFHEPLIKRVIATGGQTINIDYDLNKVYVDGVELNEPYIREDFMVKKSDYREFPYTVPEGYLFCMGDNRNGSTDSRSHLVGPIDEREILGKAVIRLLPLGDPDIYDYE